MKTRIRVIEYNSGRKEYVCEYRVAPNAIAYQYLTIFVIAYFVFLMDGWDYLVIVDKEKPNRKAVGL